MSISNDQYRDVLRFFPAGVTVVTAGKDQDIHGMTVSAFTSVSANPPLIAAIIDRGHGILPYLKEDGAPFAVNILAQDQKHISNNFAFTRVEERFRFGDWTTAATGSPILTDALAWLDCTVEQRYPVGTHIIYIGKVQASSVVRPEDRPLLYWNRNYRQVSTEFIND